jgi:hypothetical protein
MGGVKNKKTAEKIAEILSKETGPLHGSIPRTSTVPN